MVERQLGSVGTVQKRLRKISEYNPNVLSVVPDGIFGDETRDSVLSFQKNYNLPQSGEVDNDTWDKITFVYDEILRLNKLNICLKVFGEREAPILPGESDGILYVIQAMMLALSENFSNIGKVFVTGIYDNATASAVENIQIMSGITPTNSINREFANALSELYNAYISQNRILNATGNAKAQSHI